MIDVKHNVVCFGEILWDILPAAELPGGAPMNVAYHLQKLGLEPALISRVGKDDYGDRLVSLTRERGLTTEYIQIDEVHSTGLVKATIGANHEVSYDILYPVAWDFIEMTAALPTIVSNASYFVCGSLGARNETSRNTLFDLRELAGKKVLDINLRPPFYNRNLLEELLHGTDILKLNENELPVLAGWHGNYHSVAEGVMMVQDQYKIPVIIVTKGGEGAFLNVEGRGYEHQGYKVTVADTIGSGDAFLAGFLYKHFNGGRPEESLDFANLLGAFIASKTGACPNYSVEEVYKIKQPSAGLESIS